MKTNYLSKEIEDIKENQMEILELKNPTTKIKNLTNELNSRTEGERKE